MKYFSNAFIILLFSCTPVLAMGNLSGELGVKSPLIGKIAPETVLPRTHGRPVGIVKTALGKKAIIIFWATWCSHCYDELGNLNNNLDAIEAKGIKIILVDIGENKQDVRDYFKKRGMNLTSFVDTDSVMQESYYLQGVPTLVFIDEKGIVRSVTHEFPSDFTGYFSRN